MKTLPIESKAWSLTAPDRGINKVEFEHNGKKTAYTFNFSRTYNKEVKAAIGWGGTAWAVTVFLNDNTLFDYWLQTSTAKPLKTTAGEPWYLSTYESSELSAMVQTGTNSSDVHIFLEGGAKAIGYSQYSFSHIWGPELNRETLLLNYPKTTAACLTSVIGSKSSHNAYFFFENGTYLIYDQYNQKIVQNAKSVAPDWDLGPWSNDVTGCAGILETNFYYLFLKGGKVAKVNKSTNKMIDGYPKLMEEEFDSL